MPELELVGEIDRTALEFIMACCEAPLPPENGDVRGWWNYYGLDADADDNVSRNGGDDKMVGMAPLDIITTWGDANANGKIHRRKSNHDNNRRIWSSRTYRQMLLTQRLLSKMLNFCKLRIEGGEGRVHFVLDGTGLSRGVATLGGLGRYCDEISGGGVGGGEKALLNDIGNIGGENCELLLSIIVMQLNNLKAAPGDAFVAFGRGVGVGSNGIFLCEQKGTGGGDLAKNLARMIRGMCENI